MDDVTAPSEAGLGNEGNLNSCLYGLKDDFKSSVFDVVFGDKVFE